jgi:hypothetical protein
MVLILAGMLAAAQSRPAITASVDKSRILLGEPFHLTIEAVIPGGSIVRPLRIDTIPHFEFLEAPRVDTFREASGIRIRGVYKLTSFDSGHWVIPAYSISARIRTDTLGIDVVFSDFDPSQPYHDIRDIIEVEEENGDTPWWWWAVGAAALVLVAVLVLARRKKNPVVAAAVTGPGAYEEAMKALQQLTKGSRDPVLFHTELTHIFRNYVHRRHQVQSHQKTTHDLMIKLQPLVKDKTKYDRLAQALRLGDFVKFAKYKPSEEDNAGALNAVREGIDEMETRD